MRAARRVLAGLALVASLALAACGPPAPDPTTPSSATVPAPSSTATPSGTPTPDRTPTPAPTAAEPSPSGTEVPPSALPPAPRTPPPAPTWAPPTLPPAAGLPTAWRGVDIERIPTDRNVVALTFDGGGSDAAVSDILATLAAHEVAATFFVTGAFARRYPGQVRAMAAAGHPVANHSDTHLGYPDLTDARIRSDLAAASGRPAMPLFRFPFGARTEHDIRIVNDAGYLPVRWSVDSLGWKGTSGGLTADEVVDRVVRTAVPGQIVLMHLGANPDDGTTLDADALPRIIERLRALGYAFVDLDDLGR